MVRHEVARILKYEPRLFVAALTGADAKCQNPNPWLRNEMLTIKARDPGGAGRGEGGSSTLA